MPEFPHLPLPSKISAQHKPKRTPITRLIAETTQNNLQNRRLHGRALKDEVDYLLADWNTIKAARAEENLPDLPNGDIIPIFLQVDENMFTAEQLYSFGIEVIAEEEGGFIIGASGDNFTGLKEKIEKFIARDGKFKDKAAQLWNIIQGNQWRIDYILSDELKAKWDTIEDDVVFVVDISIACYIKIPIAPSKKRDESSRQYKNRYERWLANKIALEEGRFALEEVRQNELDQFIVELGGERISGFVGYDDSFSCRLQISGGGLKDFVLNYQYLFDVSEYDELTYENPDTGHEELIEVQFIQPVAESAKICIIDSGMQEGHRMIENAIDTANSRCYLQGNNSVADEVIGGGHGTKVAGAVLFGNNIPKVGSFQHTLWIQNARILNNNCLLPQSLFPPQLMFDVVNDYPDTKVFNLSVNSNRPCKTVHMSEWAAAIDKISHNQNKLFVISTGNINVSNLIPSNPGILEHLAAGRNYPSYLFQPVSRISNPAQSCFALTVGSIGSAKFDDPDRESFAGRNEPSALTRSGPGLWKMIKPDLVEYGGDYVREKNNPPIISTLPVTSAELVRTTLGGGNAIGYDIRTSFAAPKVSHIVGQVLNEIPNASANLLRTLVVQSARMPDHVFLNPNASNMSIYGYGIPSQIRATHNYKHRITLTAESTIAAKEAEIYTIKLPDEMRGVADEFNILMEVTLAFTAEPRRTRRKTRSYLSSWVDWQSSKLEENYNQFKTRISHYTEGDEVKMLVMMLKVFHGAFVKMLVGDQSKV